MSDIENDVRSYFKATFEAHGASPQGLDWNGKPSHYKRLGVVLSEVDASRGFSINDVGCGYGALLDCLFGSGRSDFTYRGYDLVDDMILEARRVWGQKSDHIEFITGGTDALIPADYTVASGTFNMKQSTPVETWHAYVLDSLTAMLATTKTRLIANFLTGYSDADHKRDDLYYPDPRDMLDFGLKATGAAAIRHNYGMYDFTLIIDKI